MICLWRSSIADLRPARERQDARDCACLVATNATSTGGGISSDGRGSKLAMSLVDESVVDQPAPFIVDTDCGPMIWRHCSTAATWRRSASSQPRRVCHTATATSARRTLDRVGLGAVPVVAGAEAPPPTTVRDKQAWELEYEGRRGGDTRHGDGDTLRRIGCSASRAMCRRRRQPSWR